MSNPKLIEELGVIIRMEGYFEPDDHTPRMRLDIIDVDKRIHLEGSTTEFESMLSLISEQVDKMSERKYLD